MKRFPYILIASVITTFSGLAFAQCPIGTVRVRGRVENLQASTAPVEISVTLETPKGNKSKMGPLSNGEFAIDVPFGTQSSSYSPLWGHRCKLVPEFVDLKATIGDHLISQVRLNLRDNFAIRDSFTYELNHELKIDASEAPKNGR
jgi:hypothetical protein